jgi:hypothetical protein
VNPEDPYDTPEERAELGTPAIFAWSGKDGLFSTWRERHVFLRGFYQGLRLGILEKLPACPAMWNDEGQYWEGGCEIGYAVRIVLLAVLVNTAGGLAVLKTTGVI